MQDPADLEAWREKQRGPEIGARGGGAHSSAQESRPRAGVCAQPASKGDPMWTPSLLVLLSWEFLFRGLTGWVPFGRCALRGGGRGKLGGEGWGR